MVDQTRKLAAIVAADVAGYSLLVREDDVGTREAIRSLRTEVIEPMIQRLGGRLANTAGDSFLWEFPNARVAVGFSIELQIAIAVRNLRIPAHQQLNYRIGITVGDVIVEGDDIHGDAVNIAGRLESIAAPGSVCVSAEVYENVRSQFHDQFIDGGRRRVKNISRLIHVWHWSNPDSPLIIAKHKQQSARNPRKSPTHRSRTKPPATALSDLVQRHKPVLRKANEENHFIVFLCGPTLSDLSKPSAQLRLKLKQALELEKFEVVLGEDDGLENGRITIGPNAQDNELEFISTSCCAVVLIADSVGAFCELGLFSWHFVHKGGRLKQTRNQTEFW